MGFIFSRRKSLGNGTTLNMSKGGVSASKRVGRFTINSRGKVSLRLGKGLRFKL